MEQNNKTERNRKEQKTAFVVLFSALAMVLEITFGLLTNSMALLADGIHMGTHVLAIGLSWTAYIVVSRLEKKKATGIDTEKILSLSAYTSGVLLFLSAVFIIAKVADRIFTTHVGIDYTEAMIVAVIGIIVNIICALVLHDKHGHKDYNSHSAYLHVLADALTSVGAIVGLTCAMIWDITWIDTLVAAVSSLVIIQWAKHLFFDTAKVLVLKNR